MLRIAGLVFLGIVLMGVSVARATEEVKMLPEELYWNGIKPGVTTLEEIKARLGEPLKSEEAPDGKIKHPDGAVSYQFDSGDRNYPHEVTFMGDKLIHVTYATQGDKAFEFSKIKEKIGEPEKITYSWYAFIYRVHIYARLGYLAIVDQQGKVVEQQYFEPEPIEEFMKKNEKKFPVENPYKY